MSNAQGILLESGNNEVEMLEFIVADQSFGINVAKVQTLIQFDPDKLTHTPANGAHIVGHYSLNDKIIPVLNIHHIFSYPIPNFTDKKQEIKEKMIVIVMQFNNMIVGALVDGMTTIHRIYWDQFTPINEFFTKPAGLVLGSFNRNNNDILIVDFEKIVSDHFDHTNMMKIIENKNAEVSTNELRQGKKIIHVDDSSTIRTIIRKALSSANYTDLKSFPDGLEAHNFFKEEVKNGKKTSDFADAVIIDIEMPKLDGLTLCKNIRETFGLHDIPIIMFSSLIDDQMKEKCKSVGATDQISKPQIIDLVNILDKFIFNK